MAMRKIKKDLKYYMNLPWTYTIETDFEKDKKFYIVCVNEFPGVCTDAPTIEEAMELIKDALHGAIELYLEHGDEIPEPVSQDEYKGNIAYRTTGRRHYKLIKAAQKTDVSLSQMIDECVDAHLKNRR